MLLICFSRIRCQSGLADKADLVFYRLGDGKKTGMKLNTKQWLGVSVFLTIVWLGMMVWLSHKYLVEKTPVRIELWRAGNNTAGAIKPVD